MMKFLNHWLLSVSWRAQIVQFSLFVGLFSLYDVSILYLDRQAPNGVSLVNYVIRDDRTDESAMYMPEIRELADGHTASTDPYLIEHRSDPSIRPEVPAWIGFILYRFGGSANIAVLLLHTVLPAVGAVLLIRLFAILVSPAAACLLALLSVSGVVYATNQYFVWLRLIDLPLTFSYTPETHLFRAYSGHLGFNRFFSPGITLPLLLIGLLPLIKDPNLRRRRNLAFFGAVLGLQLYVYPHAIIFLGLLGMSIVGLSTALEWRAGVHIVKFAKAAALRCSWIALAFTCVALPFVQHYLRFRHWTGAQDVMARVGLSDEFSDSARPTVLIWLAIGVALKLMVDRAAGSSLRKLATPADRIWVALVAASVGSTWLTGMLAYWRHFPQPWLIPLRIVSFFIPLIVGYPIVQWLALPKTQRLKNNWIYPLGKRLAIGYCGLLVFGEIAAAVNSASFYQITDEMQQFSTALKSVPPAAVILTDNLRLTAWLVCETDDYSFIGYGASSNAPNQEMIERFMIASVVQGRPFGEFYSQQYLGWNGLIWGPSGEHWTLHHGSGALSEQYSYQKLEGIYNNLANMPPEELLRRYKFDFAFLPPNRIAARYQPYFESSATPVLQRLLAVEEVERRVEVAAAGRPANSSIKQVNVK